MKTEQTNRFEALSGQQDLSRSTAMQGKLEGRTVRQKSASATLSRSTSERVEERSLAFLNQANAQQTPASQTNPSGQRMSKSARRKARKKKVKAEKRKQLTDPTQASGNGKSSVGRPPQSADSRQSTSPVETAASRYAQSNDHRLQPTRLQGSVSSQPQRRSQPSRQVTDDKIQTAIRSRGILCFQEAEIKAIRFSQGNVSNFSRDTHNREISLDELQRELESKGFDSRIPMNFVLMPDGKLTSADNRRLLAAKRIIQLKEKQRQQGGRTREFTIYARIHRHKEELPATSRSWDISLGILRNKFRGYDHHECLKGHKERTWGGLVRIRMATAYRENFMKDDGYQRFPEVVKSRSS